MEVQITAEQEEQISPIANYDGTPAEQLVKQPALRLVEEDAEIRDGIRRVIHYLISPHIYFRPTQE